MKRTYLLTSALPYINGVKHLGNLVGSLLPGDVYSRFLRQEEEDVLYICGTDEHGTPAEIAAKEAKETVEDYCQDLYKIQKSLYEQFHIFFDHFGRTSSSSNHQFTTQLFKEIYHQGYITKKTLEQFYCEEEKRFLPDRYIQGTCPHCAYEKARGDQCDGCGKLLDPLELKDPYSTTTGSSRLILKNTSHFFLNLASLAPQIEQWVQTKDWTPLVKGIAHKWLKEGLKERCITRDLSWGVPVPTMGETDMENKVFYVWFDAPNGYVSITQDWAELRGEPDLWKKYWMPQDPNTVIYTQFMGKDNVPFHSIFWPGMLMASGQPIKQVDTLKAFSWLSYDGGKFSTSQKRGIFMDDALDLFPADYWRYYLMCQCPESQDSDFTFHHFASIVNKDLANVLGNLTQRVLSLWHKYFDGQIPRSLTREEYDEDLLDKVRTLTQGVKEAFQSLQFRQGLQSMRALWALGNEYIAQSAPWSLVKEGRKEAALKVLLHGLLILRACAIVSHSVIPKSAYELFRLLGLAPESSSSETVPWSLGLPFAKAYEWQGVFPIGHQLLPPEPLFQKIDDHQVKDLEAQFQGTP